MQIVDCLLNAGAGEEYKSASPEILDQSQDSGDASHIGAAQAYKRQINSPLHWACYKVRQHHRTKAETAGSPYI